MIDGAGKATIIDFGSAQVAGLDEVVPRQSGDAAFAGTMQYSAPELFLGYQASEVSDVFSLGVIAYQMLTGALPYGTRVSGANTPAAQRALNYTPARDINSDIPDWVDAALAHALAVEPVKRCLTPAEFIGNLANPNRDLMRHLPRGSRTRPVERMWQLIAFLLAAALIVAVLTRPDFNLP